ncbi:MAG: EamA family transporter, partial [Erysipelotrichaceae bacterium]|nr:EamA family transporter [Erysipelotrichaceae bacterium]
SFFRGLIGALSLVVFVYLIKGDHWQKVERKKLLGMILNGAFLGINWILFFEAFNYTTIAKATLAYYMQPTILMLLSPLIFKERLTVKKMICALLALFGMACVSGVFASTGPLPGDGRGIMLGLGAAFFYTMIIVLNKKIEGVDSYQKTIIQLLSAAITLIPYLLLKGEFMTMPFDLKTIGLILVCGVVYTGLVYALYFGSMNGLKAQTISTLSYIDPVVAMLVSGFILHESLPATGLLGAVLIIGSALVSELKS